MEITPFRGWRFCTESNGDVSACIAPPYDVLTGEDKQELLAQGERNIVTVDLPHVPPHGAGPDDVYQAAVDTLARWAAQGVVRHEAQEAIYVYEQTYRWAGRTHIRRAMICGVRATEFGRDVIPHEHTFPGPKADRLKLTQFTRKQLSPIFGFYRDPEETITTMLSATADSAPLAHGQLRDVEEKLWAVTDADTIAEIARLLRNVPVFIADGHHRYTTAMNYRDGLLAEGRIHENHPARFVMFALVARHDPGLLVLPTHRIVRNLSEDFSIDKLVESVTEFTWRRCSVEDADLTDAGAFLHRYGPGAMAFMGADPAEIWIGKLNDPQAMVEAAPDQLDAWRNLDVAILHKLIIDKALSRWRTDSLFIDYTPNGRSVLAACKARSSQLGICLQSTPIEAVEAIGLAGAAMPHKSTYFYPKLATGMVWMPLE